MIPNPLNNRQYSLFSDKWYPYIRILYISNYKNGGMT